jgi:hypothetical protein
MGLEFIADTNLLLQNKSNASHCEIMNYFPLSGKMFQIQILDLNEIRVMYQVTVGQAAFGHVGNAAKPLFKPSCPSVRTHVTTRQLLNGFSLN